MTRLTIEERLIVKAKNAGMTRKIIAIGCLYMIAVSAGVSAATTTLYFQGTILPGSLVNERGSTSNWDYQAFAGTITFDPATSTSGGDPTLGSQIYSSIDGAMTMTLCLPGGVSVESNRRAS